MVLISSRVYYYIGVNILFADGYGEKQPLLSCIGDGQIYMPRSLVKVSITYQVVAAENAVFVYSPISNDLVHIQHSTISNHNVVACFI